MYLFKQNRYIKWLSAGIFALVLVGIIQINNLKSVSAVNSVKNHQKSEAAVTHVQQIGKKELNNAKVVTLTSGFMNVLKQDIDDHNQVIHYNSKEELLAAFEKVTTRDLAAEYVDFYYMEKENGLFIKPTETPPWFNPENDYDKIRIDDQTVQIIQHNKTDLYGAYTIKLEFTYTNKWKITNVTYGS